MKTQVPDNHEVCSRCKAWRDCWIAPNGKHLCDECKDEFGLWCCDRCNDLAPQVSFVWFGDHHLCYGCLSKETARLADVHIRYVANNPDVAIYLKTKTRGGNAL